MALKPPPAQTVQGRVIYHENPQVDAQIRRVKCLRDQGYTLAAIQEKVGISRQCLFDHFRQIDLAQKAYIEAFPAEFSSGAKAVKMAIARRLEFDVVLREELARLPSDDISYRRSIYRLILENQHAMERLAGFHITRLARQGEIAIKSELKVLLDNDPGHDEVLGSAC